MNQTVQLVNPKMPASFMVDEAVVAQVLEKATQAVRDGKAKSASEYFNNLLKWALENNKISNPDV